ncbi:5-formyltetrahydrofolate cyclo-ligase [Aureococcus anophagefferens]|nr:5-formyltetrahydrofolate cyclo-ligase [Aureococcus anophagefferens]
MELLFAVLWACATALITPTPRISLHKTALQATTYRIYNVAVPFEADPGASASSEEVSAGLVAATRQQVKKLQEKGKTKKKKRATLRSVRHVVRKSLDARHRLPEPRWVYVVDAEVDGDLAESSGRCEALLRPASSAPPAVASLAKKRRAVVVGCGPAVSSRRCSSGGGFGVAVLERGEPVEERRTSAVLRTLVFHGAPREILSQGSPHLGTDGLIGILKSLRKRLLEAGVDVRFGARVDGFLKDGDRCVGVSVVEGGKQLTFDADAVVVASGHSAEDVYDALGDAGAALEAKPIAVGFRVEHPQALINRIAYKDLGGRVTTGNRRTDRLNAETCGAAEGPRLPVAAYRLAADDVEGKGRGCYSFCMCPGGQIVPALTRPDLMVVNGMSYSRRHSVFANSAIVATVSADDPVLEPFAKHGARRVLEFQRSLERAAAALGGGDFVCPVQRLPDFVDGRTPKAGSQPPASSYRLGVKEAPCHDLLPPALVETIAAAATDAFERSMPGFVCGDAILHGVETRTSAPLRVPRDDDSKESTSLPGLYPCGEGAGYAGGIVSPPSRRRVRAATHGAPATDIAQNIGVLDVPRVRRAPSAP